MFFIVFYKAGRKGTGYFYAAENGWKTRAKTEPGYVSAVLDELK